VNLGYDAKRKLLENEIETEPFINIEEAYKERKLVKYLTKVNIRKNSENVLFYRKKREAVTDGKSLRIQGSREETIVRVIISSMLQEK